MRGAGARFVVDRPSAGKHRAGTPYTFRVISPREHSGARVPRWDPKKRHQKKPCPPPLYKTLFGLCGGGGGFFRIPYPKKARGRFARWPAHAKRSAFPRLLSNGARSAEAGETGKGAAHLATAPGVPGQASGPGCDGIPGPARPGLGWRRGGCWPFLPTYISIAGAAKGRTVNHRRQSGGNPPGVAGRAQPRPISNRRNRPAGGPNREHARQKRARFLEPWGSRA